MVAGAVIFGLTYQQVMPGILKVSNLGNVVMPDLWNLDPFLTVLTFSIMALLLFYAIDRMGMQRTSSEQ